MAHMESPTPLLSCSLVRFEPAPHLSSVLCHAVQSYADASNKCTTNPIFGNAWSTDTCCGISLCSEDQTVVFLLLSYLSHSSFELWFITPWKIISSADIATKATNYSYKSWCQFSIYWETSYILCTAVYSICSWYWWLYTLLCNTLPYKVSDFCIKSCGEPLRFGKQVSVNIIFVSPLSLLLMNNNTRYGSLLLWFCLIA